MIRRRQIIHLLLFAVILITAVASCEKNDESNGDGQSAGTLTDADGNVYNTIKMGSQVWMAENLRTTKYNDSIEMKNVSSDEQWDTLSTGAYCSYDNLESNVTTYGMLYNWYAINSGKLAPAGWHVPTEEDWTNLENYLIANGYNYDGTKDLDKIAKSLASTTGWTVSDSPGSPGANPEKNNATGLTALPGGYRIKEGGFYALGAFCSWWSASECTADGACCRWIYYSESYFSSVASYKASGASVRLIKD
jgi:uncharacterized protein (TIGR02145 family)